MDQTPEEVLSSIGRVVAEKKEKKEKKKEKKRGRGRPRKEPLEFFEEEDEVIEEAAPVDDGIIIDPDGGVMDKETLIRKTNKVGIIIELKERFKATGSGMKYPNTDVEESKLDEEILLLQNEINSRSGKEFVKEIVINISYAIEVFSGMWIDKEKVDLTDFHKQIDRHYAMLEDSIDQVAILNRNKLKFNPYTVIAGKLIKIGKATDFQNKMRARAAAANADADDADDADDNSSA